jgi:sugar phosphate isomerase/epimerase
VRFRHHDGTTVHVAYCTNVHAAESLAGVVDQLRRFGEPVRKRLGVDRLGLGLWLARPVASELIADPAAVARLRAELDGRGLEVVTLNGFPYRGFPAPVVRHAVYHPDWADPRRTRYTLDLARLLAALMPDDAARGSISTLPLGWREPWTPARSIRAARQFDLLSEGLAGVDRPIRVGFEPEPGCVVENTAQAVTHLRNADTTRLGICLDTCHLAVAFEDPAQALDALAVAGLPVVKVQASSALHARTPRDPATRYALSSFVERKFLHQTREGVQYGVDDLDTALAGGLPGHAPWRAHFHVPLHADPRPPLSTTRSVLRATLEGLFGGTTAGTDHVEVETYAWHVVPGQPTGDGALVRGLTAELDWTREELLGLGLVEVGG